MNHVIDCLEPLVDGIFLLIRDNEEAVELVLFNPYSWTILGQRRSPLLTAYRHFQVSVRQGGHVVIIIIHVARIFARNQDTPLFRKGVNVEQQMPQPLTC
jgi:hypothetical protein